MGEGVSSISSPGDFYFKDFEQCAEGSRYET